MSVEQHTEHELGHIQSESTYLSVLGALLVLTGVTILVAKAPIFDFGNWNIAIAMIIASVKAALVGLYFMHLRYENPLTWLYAALPLFLLALLMGGIFIDNPLRSDPTKGTFLEERVLAEREAAKEAAAGSSHGAH